MKDYKSYMDRVTVSEECHNKLLGLAESQKVSRRPVWRKYGALAACAVLLVGAGIYALRHGRDWDALVSGFGPSADFEEIALEQPAIDLAPVDGDDIEPGMKTIPGFEVRENRGGVDVVNYYVLPWIDYGSKDGVSSGSQVCLDYAPPEDATFRALSHDDVLALVGGEKALGTLLDWDGFEFTGSITFNADGTVWQMGFSGKRDDFYFNLELAPNALPLTCVIVEPHTTTEIWGVEVTGRFAGIYGEGPDREVWMPESREVEFIAKGVGCRFSLYGLEGQSEAVDTMVSRFVRHAILEGLDLSAVTPEGASAPVDIGPDAPWDEPYVDPAPAASSPAENGSVPSNPPVTGVDPEEAEPSDGAASTPAYDPNEG